MTPEICGGLDEVLSFYRPPGATTDSVTDSPCDELPADAFLTGLFREHHLQFVRLATFILDDLGTAEDVVQEAFVAMHRRFDRLEQPDKALGYARKCVVNGCRGVLRRRKIASRLRLRHEPPAWSAESAALLSEDRREVFLALRTLPHRQREALVLRYYLDLSEGEIAEAMGISRGTVKSTTSRALTALARKLQGNA